MNADDRKKLEGIGSKTRNDGSWLSWEEAGWLMALVKSESAEVERLMVLATRYSDERITAEARCAKLENGLKKCSKCQSRIALLICNPRGRRKRNE